MKESPEEIAQPDPHSEAGIARAAHALIQTQLDFMGMQDKVLRELKAELTGVRRLMFYILVAILFIQPFILGVIL